jgi:hypothetical protein
VIGIIKPVQVGSSHRRSQNDYQTARTRLKSPSPQFDSAMFLRLLTWIGLPVLYIIYPVLPCLSIPATCRALARPVDHLVRSSLRAHW